jgi:uncharacterized cupin superfamily protein
MYGTQVRLTYPEELNFQSEDTIIIRYIMDSPNYANKIKLNPESSDLECEDLNEMKKCIVPITHFDNKESGYYYTFHSNHLNDSSIYYESNPINVILPPLDKRIEIILEEELNHNIINIGIKGTLYFRTNYNDSENIFNISDIEENTKFETTITDEDNNEYNVLCRLWKPEIGKFRVFCDLNETLSKKEGNIQFNSAHLKYDDYQVIISSNGTLFTVKQFDKVIPFLYSDRQIIDIKEEKDYELKFKIGKYNNEILYFTGVTLGYKIFEDCKTEENDLICSFKKEDIEEMMAHDNDIFTLSYQIDMEGIYQFATIYPIIINYDDI